MCSNDTTGFSSQNCGGGQRSIYSTVRISWLCLCQKSTNKMGDRFHHFHPLNQPPLILCKPIFCCGSSWSATQSQTPPGFSHHARRRSWKLSRMLRNDGSSRSNNGCTSIFTRRATLGTFRTVFGPTARFFFTKGQQKFPPVEFRGSFEEPFFLKFPMGI